MTKSTKTAKAAKAVSVKPTENPNYNINAARMADIAKLAKLSVSQAKARAPLYAELHKAGIPAYENLAADEKRRVKVAIIVARHGQAFADWLYPEKRGTGKKTWSLNMYDVNAGIHTPTTLDRSGWQNRAGAWVRDALGGYATFIAAREALAADPTGENATAATGARRVATPAESTLNELAKQRNKIVRLIDKARDEKHVKDREHLAAFGDARAVIKALDQAASIIKKSK